MRKIPNINTHIFKQPNLPWSEGFNPLSLFPKLWVDATDLTALSLSGTDVISMLDKSGNGYDFTQVTPANRPVVDNALNPTKITFTEANSEFLDGSTHLPNFTGDSQGEFVIVGSRVLDLYTMFLSISDSAQSSNYFATSIDINGAIVLLEDGYIKRRFDNTDTSNDDLSTYVVNFSSSGTDYSLFRNNNLLTITNGIDDGDWIADHVSTPNSLLISAVELSSTITTRSSTIKEIIYFPVQLRTPQRADLYNYLALKHSI